MKINKITKKDLLNNIELLKTKLAKNEIEHIKGQDYIFNSPVFWLDKTKSILIYMKEGKLIFKNK